MMPQIIVKMAITLALACTVNAETITGQVVGGADDDNITVLDVDKVQRQWPNVAARPRGFADNEVLRGKDAALFERLMTLWRKKDPAAVLFQKDDSPYTAGHGDQTTADTSDDGIRAIRVLNDGIAKYLGDTGGNNVHPYEPRIVPGNATLQQIANAFGTKFQGFGLRSDLLADQKRKYGFINGSYFGGAVYLRDVGQDRPHLSIRGHEITHQMARTSTDLYQQKKGAEVLWIGSEPRLAVAGQQPQYAGRSD